MQRSSVLGLRVMYVAASVDESSRITVCIPSGSSSGAGFLEMSATNYVRTILGVVAGVVGMVSFR